METVSVNTRVGITSECHANTDEAREVEGSDRRGYGPIDWLLEASVGHGGDVEITWAVT